MISADLRPYADCIRTQPKMLASDAALLPSYGGMGFSSTKSGHSPALYFPAL